MEKEIYLSLFERIKNKRFFGRYLDYKKIEEYLQSLSSKFVIKEEGESVQGRSIYSIEFGQGETRILMWAQMHGNETTTTKAVLDFLEAVQQPDTFITQLTNSCRFKIIAVLNPDGAVAYTRRNANDVDLNRDAVNQTQPELRLLQRVAEQFQPDFCFNMHDQRTIYGVGNQPKSATLSFLAPAYNTGRSINPSRKIAMQLIAGIATHLQKTALSGYIGRYDDAYNPNCVGDYFQARNIPTLLFEAGHYPHDYEREITRQYVFIAMCKAFEMISRQSWNTYSTDEYLKIPENQKSFYDIIIRSALHREKVTDIAVQYEEQLFQNTIKFIPRIVEIKKLKKFYGHIEIDANQQNVTSSSNEEIEIEFVVKNIIINNRKISLILTNN